MHWKDKFKIVEECLLVNEDIEQDFYIKDTGANLNFFSLIRKEFPFVSDEYIQFMEITDGADIAQCDLYDSSQYSQRQNYLDIYSKENWLPIGHEAGGDPLLLHSSGKVAIGSGKSSSGEYEFLANSFSSFISEVLMGFNYPSIFRLKKEEYAEFISEEQKEDPWLAFLLEQKWIDKNA